MADQLKFASFYLELEKVAEVPVFETKRDFLRKYRDEVVLLVLNLHTLGVVGGEASLHLDPPESCDFCSQRLKEFGFFVDGTTNNGSWANMCPGCFVAKGTGLGWGIGQLYMANRIDEWVCIAGGNPDVGVGEDVVT